MFTFFFFNDTATTEIYTLSLHDALPICNLDIVTVALNLYMHGIDPKLDFTDLNSVLEVYRSEEHTSELQSQSNLVCRLLLEKKKRTVLWWRLRIFVSPFDHQTTPAPRST